MNFLFFFVHPSKYHLFRFTINQLITNNHKVKVLITSKDVLEPLIKNENWDYKNIFPEGRKIKHIPTKLGATINTFRSLYRLNKNISKDKYDLFITDDLLTFLGKLKRVPTILFQDDDISAVPESVLLLAAANHILAPNCTNFGKFNNKKIGIMGFKASGYLHPNKFIPDNKVIGKYNLADKRYFIIRLVSLAATHDVGKKGLTNSDIELIINKLEKKGDVIIISERNVSEHLKKYCMKIEPVDLMHLINWAELFISDSQTMSMEAAFLGTPYIRFNDFVGRISYLDELENTYKLGFGIQTKDKERLFSKIDELIEIKDLRSRWEFKRKTLLDETIDLSNFMIWLFENYPESIQTLKKYPEYQFNFR